MHLKELWSHAVVVYPERSVVSRETKGRQRGSRFCPKGGGGLTLSSWQRCSKPRDTRHEFLLNLRNWSLVTSHGDARQCHWDTVTWWSSPSLLPSLWFTESHPRGTAILLTSIRVRKHDDMTGKFRFFPRDTDKKCACARHLVAAVVHPNIYKYIFCRDE